MTLQEAILSSIAPAMALIVEILNPVSEIIIAKSVSGYTGAAAELADLDAEPGVREKQIEIASAIIGRTAGAAVEVYAMVLTWISITSGITPVILDALGPEPSGIIVGAWLFMSAVISIKFFQHRNYYQLGGPIAWLSLLKMTGSRLISWILVLMNALVLTIVWCYGLEHGVRLSLQDLHAADPGDTYQVYIHVS